MASIVYNSYKTRILGSGTPIDLDGDTIKMAVLTSSYTPTAEHDFFDDVSAFEVGASGSYSAGGATLTVTLTQDDTDDEGVFDAADVSFTSATISGRYLCIYKSTGVSSTSPLIATIDLGSTYSSTAGTWAVTFPAEGILNVN